MQTIKLSYNIPGILEWLDKPGHITKYQKAVISGAIKELCHRLKDQIKDGKLDLTVGE